MSYEAFVHDNPKRPPVALLPEASPVAISTCCTYSEHFGSNVVRSAYDGVRELPPRRRATSSLAMVEGCASVGRRRECGAWQGVNVGVYLGAQAAVRELHVAS